MDGSVDGPNEVHFYLFNSLPGRQAEEGIDRQSVKTTFVGIFGMRCD